MTSQYAYGLWPLVIIHSAVILIFAFSFSHPATKRDWRCFGGFSAFIVALFTEMYGFPLTIYLLSGWLSSRVPGVDLYSHESGHVWYTLLGFHGNPHYHPLHIASNMLIAGGFLLLLYSWRVLYRAQVSGHLATTGPYRLIRHPQYVAFIIIMLGYLLQWPALSTLIIFPVMVWLYIRQARREDEQLMGGEIAAAAFNHEYDHYYARTPAFIPRPASLVRWSSSTGARSSRRNSGQKPAASAAELNNGLK